MVDSLVEAVIAEPERFLSYIRNWDNIKSIEDLVRAIYNSFGHHWVGRNIFKSDEIKTAINILWKDRITQSHVKKNLERDNKGKLLKQELKKRKSQRLTYQEEKKKVEKNLTVRRKDGSTYTRSNNKWTDREEEWLNKNKSKKPSVLLELFNLIFSRPRTKSSISSKVRRLKKK